MTFQQTRARRPLVGYKGPADLICHQEVIGLLGLWTTAIGCAQGDGPQMKKARYDSVGMEEGKLGTVRRRNRWK